MKFQIYRNCNAAQNRTYRKLAFDSPHTQSTVAKRKEMATFRVRDVNVPNFHESQSNAYKVFRGFFDTMTQILASDETVIRSELYIRDHGAEDEIKYRLFESCDNLTCVTGVTGIGKSTKLRYASGLMNCTTKIDDGNVIIPAFIEQTFFSNGEIDPETYVSNVIGGACSMILGKAKFSSICPDSDFVDFIRSNKAETLSTIQKHVGREPSDSDLLDALSTNNSRAYNLMKLKVLINNFNKLHGVDVKRIIIVLDDIEQLEQCVQLKFIESFLKTIACLRNNKTVAKYDVTLCIAMRPVTFENMKSDAIINGYGIPNPLIIDRPIKLNEVFKARFEKYFGDTVGDERRKISLRYNQLIDICDALAEDKKTDFFSYLSNLNLRDALALFNSLLKNKKWLELERESRRDGAFGSEPLEIDARQINVISALGCGNGVTYSDGGAFNVLPNILPNYASTQSKIELLQILVFLRNQAGSSSFYVEKSTDITPLVACLRQLSHNPDDKVNEIINAKVHLQKCKLVHESDDRSGKVILCPRAWAILDKVQTNSMLIEMFRDDIWLTDDNFKSMPNKLMKRHELFGELFSILLSCIDEEYRLLETGFKADPGLVTAYRTLMGEHPVSWYIVSGAMISYNAYFKQNDQNLPLKKKAEVEKRYKKLEDIFNA